MRGYPQFLSPLLPSNLPLNRCPVDRKNAERRILIFRTGAMGDILMGTPLLAALRKAYPTAFITWAAEYNHLDILMANPYLDEVIRWDGGFWNNRLKKIRRRPRFAFYFLRFAAELRKRRFDTFVSFEADQFSWLSRAVGARESVGFFDYFAQFNVANYQHKQFYKTSYTREDLPVHRTDQNLLALVPLGLPQPPLSEKGMILGYTADDIAHVDTLCHEAGIANEPYIVLVPKTTWITKCWSPERWVELGDKLQARYGNRIILLGSAPEREAVEAIADEMRQPPTVWAGNLTLRQAAAAIAGATLLVSGDTGPMHMAAALGTPFVALFGATPTDVLAPLVGSSEIIFHPVPCGPCHHRDCANADHPILCMDLITVEEVLFAVSRLRNTAHPLPVVS